MRYLALIAGLALQLGACKAKPSGDSASSSAGSAALPPAGSAAVAPVVAAPSGPSIKDVATRLEKVGFKVSNSVPIPGTEWPSATLSFADFTIHVHALGETTVPNQAVHVATGSGAALRLSWKPAAPDQAAPDLAAYAKELTTVAKLVALDRTDNQLFSKPELAALAKTWGLTDENSPTHGQLGEEAIINSNSYRGSAGTLRIDLVQYLGKASSHLLGTTLVDIESSQTEKREAAIAALKAPGS